jgi:hypothetical protein
VKTGALWAAVLLVPTLVLAQPSWQPDAEETEVALELFHAVMTPNFPTTETLGKGDFHYEISHRFHP